MELTVCFRRWAGKSVKVLLGSNSDEGSTFVQVKLLHGLQLLDLAGLSWMALRLLDRAGLLHFVDSPQLYSFRAENQPHCPSAAHHCATIRCAVGERQRPV